MAYGSQDSILDLTPGPFPACWLIPPSVANSILDLPHLNAIHSIIQWNY